MTFPLAGRPLTSPVLLAPMAGITDLPFRRLVARLGAGLVVSEMVASQEMVAAKPGVRARAELGLAEDATAVQLAGREPGWMAEAARIVAGQGARIIDINMGCPAKAVTTGASGSALMREPDRALRLIAAVVGAVDVPVSVKMRLGWDDASRNAATLARRAEAAGVAMVTVHGRTRCQFYRGRAGRPAPAAPRGGVLLDLVAGHYEAMLGFYGRDLGIRVARKHLGWYMDAVGTQRPLRRAILTDGDPAAVLARLPEALASGAAGPDAKAAA